MSPIVVLIIIVALLLLALFSGSMISLAMGLVAIIGVVFLVPHPMLATLGHVSWSATFNFLLTCAPLFLFMGYMISGSGLNRFLFNLFTGWLGRLPGGVIHAVLAGAGVFGAATGSSTADAATMAVVAYPEMRKRGYDINLTTGALAAGGTVGILMPPSMTMILYSALTGVSLGKVFIGGILPAILMVGSFIVTTVVVVKMKPRLAPRELPTTVKEKAIATLQAVPILLTIATVLGSIYFGIATPTEASAIGASASLILAVLYRRFNFRLLSESLHQAVIVISFLMMIIVCAMVLIFVLNYFNITGFLTSAIANLTISRYVILVGIYLLMIALGCVIESVSLIVLATPLLFPAITALGFDEVWFGVIFTICIQIGLVTPPVGLNLYVIKGVCPDSSIEGIATGAAPYIVAQIFTLAMCTIFPQIVLTLPSQMK